MPIEKCTKNGTSGFRYGNSGRCYTGPGAKRKAAKQGIAESYNGGEKFKGTTVLAELLDYDYEFDDAAFNELVDDLSTTDRVVAYISKKERDSVDKADFGDPGSRKYPIRNQHDLDSAAKLIGRAPASKQAAIKSRIKEIAKRKGLKLPESWS